MFEIPIFGGIPITESVAVTWVIMAVMTIAAILLTRNLRVENVSRKQLLLESAFTFFYNFFEGILVNVENVIFPT